MKIQEFKEKRALEIKEIESFAYRYLSRQEVSIITGVPLEKLIGQETEESLAFLRGRLIRKAEFHESIIQLSKQLSSPAMQIEQKIAEQTFLNDSKR